MCSDSVGSILQEKSNEALSVFQWKSLVKELKDNAPLLFDLMWGCTTTKKPRMNREATIGICAAILLNFRYPKMNLAQKIISLVLYRRRWLLSVGAYSFCQQENERLTANMRLTANIWAGSL